MVRDDELMELDRVNEVERHAHRRWAAVESSR